MSPVRSRSPAPFSDQFQLDTCCPGGLGQVRGLHHVRALHSCSERGIKLLRPGRGRLKAPPCLCNESKDSGTGSGLQHSALWDQLEDHAFSMWHCAAAKLSYAIEPMELAEN